MSLSKKIEGTEYIGTWSDRKTPVYDILDIYGLNKIVGYVKHRYASEGTVLFRGQCRIYKHLVPSIKHEADKQEKNYLILKETINKIYKDKSFEEYFDFNKMVKGWEIYAKTTFEAVLQHYGAKTLSVDFVDNLWVALWFGLYSYNSKQKNYLRRNSEESTCNVEEGIIEYYSLHDKRVDDFKKKYGDMSIAMFSKDNIEKGKQYIIDTIESHGMNSFGENRNEDIDVVSNIDNNTNREKIRKKYQSLVNEKELALKRYQERNNEPLLFLYLYLAETEVPEVHGLYLGKKTYTVDLRRAIPSSFLRPVAQHGWIVKGIEENYSFDDDVVCVLRLTVKMVDELLGHGELLSQENFFPTPKIDNGYLYLLQHQEGSGFEKKGEDTILPKDMLTCYNYGM